MRAAKQVLVCGALVALCPGASFADKFAGAFLEGGAGARAIGMGNAFTAVAADPSAIYWNPAGLASTTHNELLISHEFRFGDLIDYSFGGGVYQVEQRNGRLAFGVIRLGIDNIAFTDSTLWHDDNRNGRIDNNEYEFDAQRDADKIHWVNDAEYGIFLSYAQPAGRWQVGGNLKLLRQSVGEFSSFGMGLDFGLLRPNLLPSFDVGLTLHDLTSTYLSWSTGRKETISPVPRLGWAYHRPSATMRGVLLLSGDVELHLDDRRGADQVWAGNLSANLDWGLEFTMQNRLSLRLGLAESAFQAGAGLVAGPVHFDYGIVPDAQDFGLSQRLSLHYVHGG